MLAHGKHLLVVHGYGILENIINMAYVDKIKDKTIVVNGDEIPVSSRLKSKIKKEYSQYCKENARFC